MKRLTIILMVAGLAFLGYACGSSTSNDDIDPVDPIVGDWISEGDNVAQGLQDLVNTESITASFSEDNSYVVVSVDESGSEVTFTGTYETGEETSSGIRSIRLEQAQPVSVVSEGIFEIDGNTMTYEVIQTDPDIGATAPTVEGGFGSTVIGGQETGSYWVQTFVRQ